MVETRKLAKEQAEKIAQLTSSVYAQGSSWVLKDLDVNKGTEKLTRGLSVKAAKKKLHICRKEKIENLLREERKASAFIIRIWKENPNWHGEGIWEWACKSWYTTKEAAENALNKKIAQVNESVKKYEIYETVTEKVPGHFNVA